MGPQIPVGRTGGFEAPQAMPPSRRRAVLAAAAFLTLVTCLLLPGVAVPGDAEASLRARADPAIEAAVAGAVIDHLVVARIPHSVRPDADRASLDPARGRRCRHAEDAGAA